MCSSDLPIPSYLHALGYAASFIWQSFKSERAVAHINRVRALERAGLSENSFNLLVFGTFNNAPVHKLDTLRLVFKWRADGHLMGRPLDPATKTSQGR